AAASCRHHDHRRQELLDERSTRELTLASAGLAGRQPGDSGELLPPCPCRIFPPPPPRRASHTFKKPMVLHLHVTGDSTVTSPCRSVVRWPANGYTRCPWRC